MARDWGGISESMARGYEMGRAGGGKLSGVSLALKTLLATMVEDKQMRKKALMDLSTKQAELEMEEPYAMRLLEKKAELEAPYKKQKELGKNILGVVGGILPSEEIFPKETIEAVSPLGLGKIREGGEVLTPPGATYKDGIIYSPTGKKIGSYLPGYEPTKQVEIGKKMFPGVLGEQLGITREEATREYLGLPKKAILKDVSPTTALGILSDPFKAPQLKRNYPDIYKKLEQIVKDAFGEGVLGEVGLEGEELDVENINW